MTISIPTEYHELVVVDNVNNDEWMHQVIALYYRPAYEFHTDFGLLFSIKRCNQEQMQSILENGGDGISFEATDGKIITSFTSQQTFNGVPQKNTANIKRFVML